MSKTDSLGDRMKQNYEGRSQTYLPRRTYTLIRLDGKSFHNYLKGCERPYDLGLMSDMDDTTKYLCENIQGCKLGYVQSDEISLVLTDFDSIHTDAWFDGNIQKITSISASMAAAKFNQLRLMRQVGLVEPTLTDEEKEEAEAWKEHGYTPVPKKCSVTSQDMKKLAFFDSRCWAVADVEEVLNTIVWRQQDCVRNSIQMTGQSQFSHKELQGKSCDNIQEMLFQKKGINWGQDMPDGFKNGRLIRPESYEINGKDNEIIIRNRWIVLPAPVVTQDRDYYKNLLPSL